jgi:hypothetical protein
MKRLCSSLLACAVLWPAVAHSFCGFYVARGDAKLFNRASQVVLVRDQDRTVLTMNSDYQGEPREFAIVVPVPTVLEKDQIHIGDKKLVERVDAYSAPRLVEYFDENPCQVAEREEHMFKLQAAAPSVGNARGGRRDGLGVTIEAKYTVGEYDILILSASQSGGLETWLVRNGYRIPRGASRVLGSYIRQGMKFFVAKVNLQEQKKLGFSYLRPIQVAFESPKFMLPIRLGTVNANGPQELFVYALTRKGRVETVNYRTVKLPSDLDIPVFVKNEFPDFYRDMFSNQVRKHDMTTIFTEYAWDMAWCDPCAAEPLSHEELRGLGVFWLDEGGGNVTPGRGIRAPIGGPANVFITRLHVRYDAAHFPEDLIFQETADRTNFQGRYVLRHEWKGTEDCPGARAYREGLPERRAREAKNLAELTGWDLSRIRGRMALSANWDAPEDRLKWWQRMWRK